MHFSGIHCVQSLLLTLVTLLYLLIFPLALIMLILPVIKYLAQVFGFLFILFPSHNGLVRFPFRSQSLIQSVRQHLSFLQHRLLLSDTIKICAGTQKSPVKILLLPDQNRLFSLQLKKSVQTLGLLNLTLLQSLFKLPNIQNILPNRRRQFPVLGILPSLLCLFRRSRFLRTLKNRTLCLQLDLQFMRPPEPLHLPLFIRPLVL